MHIYILFYIYFVHILYIFTTYISTSKRICKLQKYVYTYNGISYSIVEYRSKKFRLLNQ